MITQNINRLHQALWIKACRFDSIPIDSKFVVFTAKNHYADRYNKIACLAASGSSRDYVMRSLFSANPG